MATTLADAVRIQDAAKRSGAFVFVGHIFLHNPAFLAALKLLPSLGPIRYLLGEGMNGSAPHGCFRPVGLAPARSLDGQRAIFGCDPESVTAWSLHGGPSPNAAVSAFLFRGTPAVLHRQLAVIGSAPDDERRV